jgi:pSer/pThr/pTyr-binding forkhead associated (FHA) protein
MVVKIRAANGKKVGTTFLVWKSPYIIGRHEQADLKITNPQVSVYHCSIVIRGNEVWVRDMDSTNGTFINDERVKGEERLGIGDRLQVGPAVFEIIQEATGVIPEENHDNYSSTQLNIPEAPAPARPPAGNMQPKTNRLPSKTNPIPRKPGRE